MNLTQWARLQGIHPQTGYRRFRQGMLPVLAVRVNWRSVLVAPDAVIAPLNGARVKARRLLAVPGVQTAVAGHRDRLGRMNTELAESALSAHGRRLLVLDDGEVDDGLVRDMAEVLTSFCARLYGRWPARNRALKAVGCARRDIGPPGRCQCRAAGCQP